MNAETRQALEKAYRATAYCLRLEEALVLRIDAMAPELDRWLAAQGQDNWALLTAANPGSRCYDGADNARRNGKLRGRLDAWCVLPCTAIADAGDWPAEEGFLIAGMTTEAACRLAREFGQNAYLAGRRGGVVRLVWTADGP